MMHQANLQLQQQEASESRSQYESYKDQVTTYIHQVEEVCAEAHLQKEDVETRLQSAQQRANKGDETARAEVTNLRNWLKAEGNLSTQAANNVELCQRWLAHFKDRANIDTYNLGQEEQSIADEQKKLEAAQAALASEARKARDRDYWAARDDYLDNDYDGNTAVFGRRRGAHIYRSRGGSRINSSGGSGGSRSTSRITSRIGHR